MKKAILDKIAQCTPMLCKQMVKILEKRELFFGSLTTNKVQL